MNQQENAALTERAARRALYSSLFSIVACAMMLFGTTFAWFTANQTSGVNTMTAANFDVSITEGDNALADPLSAGEHTITLARLGGGTAPGYCVIKLAYTGSYTIKTGTITNTTDTEGNTTTTDGTTIETVTDGSERTYYAVFDGDRNSVSFSVKLMENYEATITKETISWGEYPPTGVEPTPVKLMARRTFSAAPQPTVTQITDGDVLDTIGHEDVEDIKIETITIEEPAAEQAEENKNDEDGLKDGAKVDAGSGNGNENNESSGIDSNGGADSGSDRSGGSGSSSGGSGAGGSTGESSGGEGGGNVSGGESSGNGDAESNGDAGTGDAGTGDAGSAGNAAEGGQT